MVPIARHLASAGDTPLRASRTAGSGPGVAPVSDPSVLAAVQIERMQLGRVEATAPAGTGRWARLTVDVGLQRTTLGLFRQHRIPDGAVVLMDQKTGRVLVYASQQSTGAPQDLCADANAPAASVFKIVTGSALVETAGLTPQTRQCYHGGSDRIIADELVDNPQKDKWCASLSEAMGRSLNAVFAKLAQRHLNENSLKAVAGAYGFGLPVPFDVQVAASQITIPADSLGFARTAAGFWNTTLSPVQAMLLASTIAGEGTMIRPVLVESVSDTMGVTLYHAPEGAQVLRKPVKPETARAVREMMEATVSTGTGYHAFHDTDGKGFLGAMRVAGKTGTLTRSQTQQYYTWFVGFAPVGDPQVAIATLVINKPKWQTRANVLARDVLRAYFASKQTPGVTKPL